MFSAPAGASGFSTLGILAKALASPPLFDAARKTPSPLALEGEGAVPSAGLDSPKSWESQGSPHTPLPHPAKKKITACLKSVFLVSKSRDKDAEMERLFTD